MADKKRHLVAGYAGVYYREVPRAGGRGLEKVYYIRYRRGGRQIEEKAGAQHRDKMTPTRAAAMRGLRIEGREPSNRERRSQLASKPPQNTFEDAWNLFAALKSGNRSLRDDASRYRLYLAPALAKKPLADIRQQDILAVRQALDGKSPQTLAHAIALLKRIANLALREGLIGNVPRAILNAEKPRVRNQGGENLTSGQLGCLMRALDEAQDQVKASAARIALFTGMRKTAILKLKWTDLDFERGYITLRGEVAKKGLTETIPMNSRARAVFEALPRNGEYVFPGRFPGRPLSGISCFMRDICNKAGLPDTFRPMHGLRHAFASWLASSGKVSMHELQKLLTHSSPQMTQRYAHLHDSALRKASELAGELFCGAAGM